MLEVVSHLVYFFDHRWVLDVPSLIVLFSKELDLLGVQILSGLLEPSIGSNNEGMSFSKSGGALVPLVLELGVELVVDHVALMDSHFSRHLHEVTHSLVQVAELGNLHSLQTQPLQVVQLRS